MLAFSLIYCLISAEIISLIRWIASVIVPIIFSYWGLKRNSLSTSGAVVGKLKIFQILVKAV